jgi:hypothetical protein
MKYLKTLVLSLIMSVSFIQSKAQVITLSKGIDHVKACVSAVKDAIAANDGATAQTKAKDIIQALNEVPLKYMTSGQSGVWAKYIGQLQSDSNHISTVSAVANQKGYLAGISINLQAAIDGLKMK